MSESAIQLNQQLQFTATLVAHACMKQQWIAVFEICCRSVIWLLPARCLAGVHLQASWARPSLLVCLSAGARRRMCTGGTPQTATMSGFRRIKQLRSWRQTSQHEVSLRGRLLALALMPYQSARRSPCEDDNQASVAASLPNSCLLHAVKQSVARLIGMHLSSSGRYVPPCQVS